MHFPSALEYVDPKEKQYPEWWLADGRAVKVAKISNRETWESLEAAVDQSIARSISMSNFQGQSLYDLFSYNKHPIPYPQIEHDPYLIQPGLINLAQIHSIVVTAYSSFGPQSFLEFLAAFRERVEGLPSPFDSEVINQIASKHGKTAAQVLLRFATRRNIAVIPKSNNKDRLVQNLDVHSFYLSKEYINFILALYQGLGFHDPGFFLKDYHLHIFA